MTSRRSQRDKPSPYPPIGDYGFIGDCHSVALISRTGSIDWCCMPRVDDASCFGRLLDWDRGGYCQLWATSAECESHRRYVDDTMVLETVLQSPGGEARILDAFTVHADGARHPYQQLLRVVDGIRGQLELTVRVAARFDYGGVKGWLRLVGPGVWTAVGGNDGLVISGDFDLDRVDDHDLLATFAVRAGQRARLSIVSARPEDLDEEVSAFSADELDQRLQATVAWWQEWAAKVKLDGPDGPAARRSALVLKALTNAPTGAVAAAATTSLPETLGGPRNWDYRYSWIRDSQFTVRSLGDVGCNTEADGFRRFIERSAAGNADSLQIMYGVGGERRLTEIELDLAGYRGSRPVRIGNAASDQLQLDVYGELLDLAWRWHQRGRSPDDDYWRFLLSLVDAAAERWPEADKGLWEMRGPPRHFVHSKAMCWAALDRGIRLGEGCLRQGPYRRWKRARDEVRDAIEGQGISPTTGNYVQAFGTEQLDASLLLLPSVEFVAYNDPTMIATTDAIAQQLDNGGLLHRYLGDDSLAGEEGVFVACTFWLVECLAHQGRIEPARATFDRALAAGNDLGLFSEEYDPGSGQLLGNFPQGLSHLSHIAAAVALYQAPARG